jgi:hypothetical protein
MKELIKMKMGTDSFEMKRYEWIVEETGVVGMYLEGVNACIESIHWRINPQNVQQLLNVEFDSNGVILCIEINLYTQQIRLSKDLDVNEGSGVSVFEVSHLVSRRNECGCFVDVDFEFELRFAENLTIQIIDQMPVERVQIAEGISCLLNESGALIGFILCFPHPELRRRFEMVYSARGQIDYSKIEEC